MCRDAKCGERVTQSRFSQSLTLIKEENEWKICCLHASTPIVTEENIDAYPLKFAEKTLQSLRDKIGEEVYAVEEQYRMAVLSDTIAFYIVNFSKDIYENASSTVKYVHMSKMEPLMSSMPGSTYPIMWQRKTESHI